MIETYDFRSSSGRYAPSRHQAEDRSTGFDHSSALTQLDKFIAGSTEHLEDMPPGVIAISYSTAVSDDELMRQSLVVERVLDRVLPTWRTVLRKPLGYETKWQPLREQAMRAKEGLEREEEIRQNLGEDAPEISAASLHPWVWSGASSLWASGHFRSAVEDAAKKVNAETQNKIGRRDVSEANLFREAFSTDPPIPGRPRLRRMPSDGSRTYESMQRGAMALAEGIYRGIRNPLNHENPEDVPEQIALEYLAAMSVLARWVDEANVELA